MAKHAAPKDYPLLFDLPRPRTSWVPPTEFPDLSGHTHLWVDTESDGLDPRKSKAIGASISNKLGWKRYFPWGHRGGGNMDENQARAWANSYQGFRGKHLTFLNGKHDLAMVRNWGCDPEQRGCHLHDVSFKAALLNDNRGYGGLDLDSLSTEYLKLQKETLGHAYGCSVDKAKMVETHSSEVGAYAETDADLVRLLDLKMWPLIEKEGLEDVLELEDSLIYCVSHMEHHGLRLDSVKSRQWHGELRAEVGELILEIWRRTGLRINPNSGPDLSRLFKKLGLSVLAETESGKESFTARELERAAKTSPVVEMVLKARRLDSLDSKYFAKFAKAGSNLYYALHQLKSSEYGTISGRFSGTNGSQQLMKVARQLERLGEGHLVRECVVPDDGQVLFAADAKQIEPRLFVHYSQDEHLIKAYQKNPELDFYTDLVYPMLTKIDSFAQMPPKTQRMYTKVGTLGKFYGLSNAESAADQLKCSVGEAEAFMREYDGAFPIVGRMMRQVMQLAERRGYVRTILGRRARFPDKKKLHTAVNRIMQGSAADVNKVKLKEMYDNRGTLGISKLRLTLHDEGVGDMDPSPVYKARLQELLDTQSLPQLTVPILWDVNTGKNWADCA